MFEKNSSALFVLNSSALFCEQKILGDCELPAK